MDSLGVRDRASLVSWLAVGQVSVVRPILPDPTYHEHSDLPECDGKALPMRKRNLPNAEQKAGGSSPLGRQALVRCEKLRGGPRQFQLEPVARRTVATQQDRRAIGER